MALQQLPQRLHTLRGIVGQLGTVDLFAQSNAADRLDYTHLPFISGLKLAGYDRIWMASKPEMAFE